MENTSKYTHRIVTIPNILSLFRLCLIPYIIWLYLVKQDSFLTGTILILSGLTDIVDGYIARHYNMISNVGKILDPIADKATQGAILLCLIVRFPWMKILLVVLVIKEIALGLSGYLVIRKQGIVMGANWHGKVATCLLYIMMIGHVFYDQISPTLSKFSVLICLSIMILSLILYVSRNYKVLKETQFRL